MRGDGALNVRLGEADNIIQKQRGDINVLTQEREEIKVQHDRVKKGGFETKGS